ncbi:MAG: glycosyltransferase family 1 protein [Eubacteriales bacterium]|nr:glycosyltransferase family 1 protein [Eubacteriales bacterium]
MKPVRVLYVGGGSLDRGGIASWMLNYASHFDRERVAVDFLVHGSESGAREAEALGLGATVYHIPYRRNDPAGNRKCLLQAIRAGYDVVHAHMDGMNAYPLELAKKAGVPVRISHSHNTDFLTGNPIRRAVHELARRRIPASATHLLSCSENAGRFLYGDALVNAGKVTIVRNAIDAGQYRYNESTRTTVRAEIGLNGRFVIGHIGRFDLRQKNQLFLLNAFAEAKKTRGALALVLVGDGQDRPQIEAQISRLGLERDVVLAGFREDVPALLSAFDLFVLPSVFEGLGIVLIEAQASGLSCLASDAIPRDTQIADCAYLSLDDTAAWANAFVHAASPITRNFPEREIIERGYAISTAAAQLQAYYEKAAGRV